MDVRQYQPLVAGVLWGTAYPCLQVILESFAPAQVVFIRVVLGTLFLGGVLAIVYGRDPFRIDLSQVVPLAVLAALSVGVFYIFQTIAVWYSTPVNVSFLVSTYPVFVAIAAPFALGESVTRTSVAGLGFAIVGAYVIIGNASLIPLFSSPTFLGDSLALLASLSFMGYLLLNRRWSTGFEFDYLTLTFFAHCFSLPIVAGFLGYTGEFSIGAISPLALVLLLWLSIAVTGGGLLALNAGLTEEKTHVAALRLLLIPAVSTILSVLFLDEGITPAKAIGGLAIGVGIVLPYLARWSRRRKTATAD
jgi:drug/metabolite transporter (DMT)-like permease